MYSPIDAKRDSIEAICTYLLKYVRPKVGIGESPGVKFCGKNEDALPMDRKGKWVPSDCISEPSRIAPYELRSDVMVRTGIAYGYEGHIEQNVECV